MKPLEEVFKTSGIPTHTFVRPVEYAALLVALRTPCRGVVIEGPLGIGKTPAVTRALEELQTADNLTRLSARRRDDLPTINAICSKRSFGTVLIDDFHRLPNTARSEIADLMKLLRPNKNVRAVQAKTAIPGPNRPFDDFEGDIIKQRAPCP